MATPKFDTFESALEMMFKSFGTGTAFYGGSVNFKDYLTDDKLTDARGALISLTQALDYVLSFVKNTPLGELAVTANLANNLTIVKQQIGADGVNPSVVVAIISDLSALSAGIALTLGPAGTPVFIAMSSISLIASVYATTKNINIGNENDQLLLNSTQALDHYEVYGRTHWEDYTKKIFLDYFNKNPITLPVLALLHELDPNVTPENALALIENSGVSNYEDGRMPEVSNIINSLRQLAFGLGTPTVSTKEEVNALVNTLWNDFKTSPLAGNVELVDNIAAPFDATSAWTDFSSFLSLRPLHNQLSAIKFSKLTKARASIR